MFQISHHIRDNVCSTKGMKQMNVVRNTAYCDYVSVESF